MTSSFVTFQPTPGNTLGILFTGNFGTEQLLFYYSPFQSGNPNPRYKGKQSMAKGVCWTFNARRHCTGCRYEHNCHKCGENTLGQYASLPQLGTMGEIELGLPGQATRFQRLICAPPKNNLRFYPQNLTKNGPPVALLVHFPLPLSLILSLRPQESFPRKPRESFELFTIYHTQTALLSMILLPPKNQQFTMLL